MSAEEVNNISDKDLFYAQMNTPENIRYFVNRIKEIVSSGLRNQWENDCYSLVVQHNELAYPVITATAQTIMRVRNYKNTDELRAFFDSLMLNTPEGFLFDEYKDLLTKYSQEYFQIINIYLFNLTDVTSKVKSYIKNIHN